MTAGFLALLSAYYLCDATATLRPLSPDTAQTCAAQYEAVKARFGTSSDPTPAARQAAYLRFKAWEASNVRLVERMRSEAASSARAALLRDRI
ncbi:MAG: hypothetical protein AAGB05_00155 [Pseudomonadota bacterium]